MIFLDSNIVIDLFGVSEEETAVWSRETYRRLSEQSFAINLVVYAELSGWADRADRLSAKLDRFDIEIMELTTESAFAAGAAYREYRRRGGVRSTILPDFLIAGHAASLGASLMTRDRQLTTYFPDLTLITPETHHG